MPVPQTFTVGAFGLATKWSASSMHTLRLPWPAPSPSTAEPSTYTFWLISSLVFRVKAAVLQASRQVKTRAEVCISEKSGGWATMPQSTDWGRRGESWAK